MSEGKRSVRVAAVQMSVVEDVATNRMTILETMARCRDMGARVCVYPETALTSYSPYVGHGREAEEWPAILAALDDIADGARRLGLWVCVGTEAWDRGVRYNRLYLYGPDGVSAAHYDKMHLMVPDTVYYAPGSRCPLVSVEGIRMGMQICYDARFPEGYRALLHNGCEVVLQGFFGAGGPAWKVPVLGAHLVSRAAESGCFVVAANVAGPEQIVHSQIVDPLGIVLATARENKEDIIVADLGMHRVEASEIRRDYLATIEG